MAAKIHDDNGHGAGSGISGAVIVPVWVAAMVAIVAIACCSGCAVSFGAGNSSTTVTIDTGIDSEIGDVSAGTKSKSDGKAKP